MSKKKKTTIQLVFLLLTCGLIIWHVVYWHSTGMYLKMFNCIGSDKTYVTVLYNLGVILVLGALFGFLTKRITDLAGYEAPELKHFDEEKTDNNR